MNKTLSIAIPIYEYNGKGTDVLNFSLNQLLLQTCQDFELVISDHSIDDAIEKECKRWSNYFDLKYLRNENDRGSGASNFNSCLKNCTGKIIKLLCADDYFFSRDAIQITLDAFDDETNFLATAYFHTRNRVNYYSPHYPQMNENIKMVNTIGTPSCVAIRNFEDMPEFDKNLKYAFDCDFYHQYISKYDKVKLINNLTIANYLWENSITSVIDNDLIMKESQYIMDKYAKNS
jgi:glycosyltransferase involved in cell wall biosynthesis